ncbi:MAG: riboflavin synthase, partial [Candidatus Peregrinibacteria bacterium]
DRLGGHMVTGHVEGVGKITQIKDDGNAKLLAIKIPKKLERYIVPKGSIAINGISLTVMDIQNDLVKIGIIPHTWKITNLHTLQKDDPVNIETDLIAKYIASWQR